MKWCLQLPVKLLAQQLGHSRCSVNVSCYHRSAEGGKVSPTLIGPQGPAPACGDASERVGLGMLEPHTVWTLGPKGPKQASHFLGTSLTRLSLSSCLQEGGNTKILNLLCATDLGDQLSQLAQD